MFKRDVIRALRKWRGRDDDPSQPWQTALAVGVIIVLALSCAGYAFR